MSGMEVLGEEQPRLEIGVGHLHCIKASLASQAQTRSSIAYCQPERAFQPGDKYTSQRHSSSCSHRAMNGLNKQERCLIKESGDVKAPLAHKTPE